MLKLFFLILPLIVLARENPFKPVIDHNITTGKQPKYQYFKEAKFLFPSSARILKEVSFKFQNIDGSIETKTIKIDKKINWHKPLYVTYRNNIEKKQEKKEVSLKKKSIKILKPFKFLSLKLDNNKIIFVTSDKLIRDFSIPRLKKIVLDFNRQTYFNFKSIKVNQKPFVKFDFGQHQGFYRVVVTLDGIYKYSIKKLSNSYELSLQ